MRGYPTARKMVPESDSLGAHRAPRRPNRATPAAALCAASRRLYLLSAVSATPHGSVAGSAKAPGGMRWLGWKTYEREQVDKRAAENCTDREGVVIGKY